MVDKNYFKNKKILMIQQRDWGVNSGHPLAIELNKLGVKLAAYTFKLGTGWFIKNQKDINYEKIVLDEDIKENSSIIVNKNKLNTKFFEDLFGFSIWKYISTLREFGYSFDKKYYYSYQKNFDDKYSLEYLLASSYSIIELIDNFKPDLIFGQYYGDFRHIVFNEYAKIKNIKMMCFIDSKFYGSHMFSYDYLNRDTPMLRRLDNLTSKNIISDNIDNAKKFLIEFRKNFTSQPKPKEVFYYNITDQIISLTDIKTFIRRLIRYIKNLKYKNSSIFFSRHDNPKLKYIFRDFFSNIRNKFIVKNLNYSNLDMIANFAYFPLQVQPESSIDAFTSIFDNQIETIKQIAKNLPNGLTLLVKDHPVFYGRRSGSYLKKILGTPNVKLVHHNENNHFIMNKMKILFSINGSAIWEAAYLKKPAILLGENRMAEILPNVIRINSYSEIFDRTKKLINKNLISNDYEVQLINYIAASMDVSFSQKYTGYEKKSEVLLKEQNDHFIKEIYYALKI